MNAESYLIDIKVKLALSNIVQSINVIDERVVLSDRGYFRARLKLSNDDFLEISEYFVIEKESCIPKRYRYQWMDGKKKLLKKRWDNAEHFHNISKSSDHIHMGKDENVVPSIPISIVEIIDIIDNELSSYTKNK